MENISILPADHPNHVGEGKGLQSNISTMDRWQSKMLFSLDECADKNL